MVTAFDPSDFAQTAEGAAATLEAWSKRNPHPQEDVKRLIEILNLIVKDPSQSPGRLVHITQGAYKDWSGSAPPAAQDLGKTVFHLRYKLMSASVEMTSINLRAAKELREFCMALAHEARKSQS